MFLARTLLSNSDVAPSRVFVLLCAEEDDLALVQWVHAARERGLAPEIVTGVEHDDAPLLDALADVDCGLFVVLRSDHLDAVRMRGIKAAFGRHRRPEQRLFALRLDTGAPAAIERIAGELAGGSRPRSEVSMVISIDELFGDAGDGADPRATATVSTSAVPSVDRALRHGARAVEREVTAQFEVGDETIPMLAAAIAAPVAAPRRAERSRRTPWLAALGLAGVSVGLAVFVATTAAPERADATTIAAEPTATAPAAIAPAAIAEAAPAEPRAPVAPVDEPPVVIRVHAEPADDPVETPLDAPRSTARHRSARRSTTDHAPIARAPLAAVTPPREVEVALAEPAPVDALPSEPAPLDAPPTAPPDTATPEPAPSPIAAESTPPAPPAP